MNRCGCLFESELRKGHVSLSVLELSVLELSVLGGVKERYEPSKNILYELDTGTTHENGRAAPETMALLL
jgi:hypothetical protein